MNSATKILVGAAVGGTIGYVCGDVLVRHLQKSITNYDDLDRFLATLSRFGSTLLGGGMGTLLVVHRL